MSFILVGPKVSAVRESYDHNLKGHLNSGRSWVAGAIKDTMLYWQIVGKRFGTEGYLKFNSIYHVYKFIKQLLWLCGIGNHYWTFCEGKEEIRIFFKFSQILRLVISDRIWQCLNL